MDNLYQIKKASLMILEKEGKILLIRRYNTGFADGMYTLPSGKLEFGETFLEAAIRETLEEVNIVVNISNLNSAFIMFEKNKKFEWIHHFFLSRIWNGEIKNMEPHKCDDLNWFDIHNLPKETLGIVKYAIKKIYIDKESYCEYVSEENK